MYKVLLVDDEYMVTEGLKRLIPFDKWDMEVVATASHADEAPRICSGKILSMWSFPMSICPTKQGLI